MAGRLLAHRKARIFFLLRSVYSYCGFDVQPAREMAKDYADDFLAEADSVVELPAHFACVAAGSQRVFAPGSGIYRSRGEQEGRRGANLSAARHQLPAVGGGPLLAKPELREPYRGGETAGTELAEYGRGGYTLHGGTRSVGLGGTPAGVARR